MRVVLDTNIILSFLLTRGETISSIFEAWDEGKFELLISEGIFQGIKRVLKYPKIKRLIKKFEADALLEKIKIQAVFIRVTEKLQVAPDKKDNKFLDCAVEGEADFIVTGDISHLLSLKEFRGIKIIKPRQFLSAIEK